ncbi:hypothetical protein ABMY11_21110 [Vibrio vulnificus]|uniref:hypothetical protein n=1 Tax=Vibrio TaxID=662 RepID=UPI000C1CC770|nr:hypothetical protein [Vibrio parahaemolyticus]EGX7690657.1 hypothetical protein [Vibrio parahaemolyticus]EHH2556815.1 hypothetical protein [Vibrio parahaemolyticus]PIS70283.1 hypothetical protein H271_10390 [Vibrio parahaemolyticus 1911C]
MEDSNSGSFEFLAFAKDEKEKLFLSEFSAQVKAENSRGKVINIVSFVDHLLAQLLVEFSPNQSKAQKLTSDLSGCLNTLMNKANMCHMLALLTDTEFEQVKFLANIRNDLAHDWRTDLTSPKLSKRIDKVSASDNGTSETKFMSICGQLVTKLHHRIEYAKILKEELPSKTLVDKISQMAPKRI